MPDENTKGTLLPMSAPEDKPFRAVRHKALLQCLEWNGRNEREVREFTNGALTFKSANRRVARIHGYYGIRNVLPGDFIVRGIDGEFFPVKRDVFRRTYEKVDGANDDGLH